MEVKLIEKLRIIQKILGLTQTKLADRLGVSFPAFNRWFNGWSQPRTKFLAAIDDLYLEVTAQKVIAPERLAEKEMILSDLSSRHDVLAEILDNPDIHDEFVLQLTYHSNAIEGSTLTEPDTAAILFDNVALPNKTLKEHLEAKNHQAALEYLFDHIRRGGAIDEALLLRLHGILLNGVYSDAGRYRDHSVRITGVHLPTANCVSVPRLMAEIATHWKDNHNNNNIINLLAKTHAQLERIHPFSDGNGRTGRLIMTGMLLKRNWAPAIIKQSQKQLYYSYLYKAQTNGDLSQLEDYLYDCVTTGFNILERKDRK